MQAAAIPVTGSHHTTILISSLPHLCPYTPSWLLSSSWAPASPDQAGQRHHYQSWLLAQPEFHTTSRPFTKTANKSNRHLFLDAQTLCRGQECSSPVTVWWCPHITSRQLFSAPWPMCPKPGTQDIPNCSFSILWNCTSSPLQSQTHTDNAHFFFLYSKVQTKLLHS